MSTVIIDGKLTAKQVQAETAAQVAALARDHKVQPGLAVVLVGNDPASAVYVGAKARQCADLNIYSLKYELPHETTQEDLIKLVHQLNKDPRIHGILVQSPPPKHINEEAVIAAISPEKDVDCFHSYNVGQMLLGSPSGFLPCTPAGVIELLKRYNLDPAGKHVVIVGRSNIVGKPMMALMVQKRRWANATVTCCHSNTVDLPSITRQGDILIAAIGKPNFIKADMVKSGAVVIDVGINRVDDASVAKGYRLVGDVDFDAVAPISSAITPVPGGVGPMTIAMLMQNTVKACIRQNNLGCE